MSRGHRLKEYLRYRGSAKSRHQVHSPFVYAFIDQALGKKTAAPNLVLATTVHQSLVNKIISYFKCRHILWLTNRVGEEETFITIEQEEGTEMKIRSGRYDAAEPERYPRPDLLLIDLEHPEDWQVAFEKYRQRLEHENIVLINSIHHSGAHTAAWQAILSLEEVKLSIDLFRVGLLFAGEAFKEKQHFILRTAS